MPVTRDDVMHIASLARLSIDEGRVPELVTQLNGILGHMDALQQADTHCAAAPSAVGVDRSPLREDAGPPIPLLHPRESFAPAMRDGLFLVPRLATHEDAEEDA